MTKTTPRPTCANPKCTISLPLAPVINQETKELFCGDNCYLEARTLAHRAELAAKSKGSAAVTPARTIAGDDAPGLYA